MPSMSLKRVYKLFRARKFTEVIHILEPQIFRYRESYTFYYILGISCLYAGDFGGAYSYLGRADQLKHGNADILLGLAAVHLKRGDMEAALKIWLDILDNNPGNRIARRGMEFSRKNISKDDKEDLFEINRIRKFYPGLPAKRGWFFKSAIFVVILLIFSGLFYFYQTDKPFAVINKRKGIETIKLDSSILGSRMPANGIKYKLSDREIKEHFNRAKKYLLKYRDNLANVEINTLLLSNAKASVKEKAMLLKTFITEPDFITIKDSFSYSTVIKMPDLYNHCYVVWRGKIVNLQKKKNEIIFDLLVGYENEKELKGIVPVVLDFAVLLNNADSVELLGEIITKKENISLRGVSIRRIAP